MSDAARVPSRATGGAADPLRDRGGRFPLNALRRLGWRGDSAWGMAAGVFLLMEIALAVAAPLIAGHNPAVGDVDQRLLPPGTPGFPLGTDALGRDVLAKMLYGAQVSLAVGGVSVLVAGAIGVLAGLLMGYYGGWVDAVGSRIVDVQLSFPFMALALTIAAVLGAGFSGIIATLVISSWVLYARLARGDAMAMKRQEFVEAARAIGAPGWRIVLRHVLPNVLGPAIALASLEAGRLIVAEASLSFLGYGIQPPMSAWGLMLADGKDYMSRAWWLTVMPGVAVSLTCLATSLMGDWLTDVLDPRMRG
ncbi:MAG TPA: ABC transporter permease [Chloroflexota bacterium]